MKMIKSIVKKQKNTLDNPRQVKDMTADLQKAQNEEEEGTIIRAQFGDIGLSFKVPDSVSELLKIQKNAKTMTILNFKGVLIGLSIK